jgi:hypothetical protein
MPAATPCFIASRLPVMLDGAPPVNSLSRKVRMVFSAFASRQPLAAAVALVLLSGCASPPTLGERPSGTLELSIVDPSTGATTAARVEVRGADGAYHVASDALRVGGDCDMSDTGAGYTDLESTLAGFGDRIENAYTGSTQFYSSGTSSVELPSGTATVRVFKGPEYEIAVQAVEIPASGRVEREIALSRWTDMPGRSWFSADDHLHIPRPTPELDPVISAMMQAEDIHVANLLQMGKVRNFAIAPQHAHGPKGHYQDGAYILAAGQENPRTHFLGHTITLGAAAAHHDPEKYLIYRLLWERTVEEGALNGFAHAYMPDGLMIGALVGMAVVAPHDLFHFVEVLQFNRSGYGAWYDLLALGFRVTPTAGTDFPCGGQTIPGHERFYTRVDGPLTYPKWIEGVRRGRTFVTTGPMVEFRVNGEDIGGEVVLPEAAWVDVSGRAVFDPMQDDLAYLELIQNGSIVQRFSRVEGASEIEFSGRYRVEESSWFAVRGYGVKLENTMAKPMHFSSFEATSNLHTAPIWVTLEDVPGIEEGTHARRVAREWLARLVDLERMLAEENLAYLARRLASPDFDGVPEETLRRNREDLLAEIRVARDFFEAYLE